MTMRDHTPRRQCKTKLRQCKTKLHILVGSTNTIRHTVLISQEVTDLFLALTTNLAGRRFGSNANSKAYNILSNVGKPLETIGKLLLVDVSGGAYRRNVMKSASSGR
ncbi:hypothetical protein TNCV_4875841 [Trichonephila clavipes]|nr:hypothetical protein TNCV_4875841 [Trichonephila clavipes]